MKSKGNIIKVWDYIDEYHSEKEEVLSALEKVLESGWLILGENVKQFEEKFSSYCNMPYGVGVNSATDAIFLGLKALGIGNGDEVITVSNTAVPTVSAIVSTGATPVFVDIELNSFLMDVNQIEDKITSKTKCILPVHLFGQCVDMDKVAEIAKKYELYVLEDCAQSHGAKYKGKIAGSMSDVSAFSFYPTKILGGYGDAGMVLAKNEELYNKLLSLRMYGMSKTYYAYEHGYNSRLDELHAAILLNKLKHLDEYIRKRRELAIRYDKLLEGVGLVLPNELDYGKHAYYVYVVKHSKRDQIIEMLRRKNIFLNISYPWPIHTMKAYKYLGYKNGDFPVTEKVSKEIFSLPMYPSLTTERQDVFIKHFKDLLITV